MSLVLAPMEGLLDWALRDVLTSCGGIDRCVSEFIRVTGTLLPRSTFLRVVPELARGGVTVSGVPVRPQLLGSDPQCLADNAARLAEISPFGVDLNFGCPARQVNRHGGGATLLREPETLYRIVAAVRAAVPPRQVVSAKMRLGYDDTSLTLDCARAIADGGASELVVHARTRAQGYRPPVQWDWIDRVRRTVAIDVIANGDIWGVADGQRCRAESGCGSLMLGRGQIGNPGLALALRSAQAPSAAPAVDSELLPWSRVLPLLGRYWWWVQRKVERRHQSGRFKQWLVYLARTEPRAALAFETLRQYSDPHRISAWLVEQGVEAPLGLEAALAEYQACGAG